MRHRMRIVALVAAALLLPAAAPAKEVRYPAAHPLVALDVPDDWSVAETSLGLELQSPQKDSLVLAGMTDGDRKSVDGWSKRALARMTSAGVVFAKTAPAKTAPANPAAPPAVEPAPGKPNADTSNAEKPKPDDAVADFVRGNSERPYSFGGAPTIGPPKVLSEDIQPVAGCLGDIDLPTASNNAVTPRPMKPSGNFLYSGGVLRGQPVDIQLSVFPFGKNKRLLMEQQSGATDARGFMIVRSLRALTR